MYIKHENPILISKPGLLRNQGEGTLLGLAVYEKQTLVVAKGWKGLDKEHMLRKLVLGLYPWVNLSLGRDAVGADHLPS